MTSAATYISLIQLLVCCMSVCGDVPSIPFDFISQNILFKLTFLPFCRLCILYRKRGAPQNAQKRGARGICRFCHMVNPALGARHILSAGPCLPFPSTKMKRLDEKKNRFVFQTIKRYKKNLNVNLTKFIAP